MIKRLSTIITTAKDYIYHRTPLRLGCYLLIILGLLLAWLYGTKTEIAFIYNAF